MFFLHSDPDVRPWDPKSDTPWALQFVLTKVDIESQCSPSLQGYTWLAGRPDSAPGVTLGISAETGRLWERNRITKTHKSPIGLVIPSTVVSFNGETSTSGKRQRLWSRWNSEAGWGKTENASIYVQQVNQCGPTQKRMTFSPQSEISGFDLFMGRWRDSRMWNQSSSRKAITWNPRWY